MDARATFMRAQFEGTEGDEAFWAGRWGQALEKYNTAISLFNEVLSSSSLDTNTQELVQKLVKRYTETTKQIQDNQDAARAMQDTFSFDNENKQLENSTQSSQIPSDRLSEDVSYLPFKSLLNENPISVVEPIKQDSNPLKYLWSGMERLLNLLPSNTTKIPVVEIESNDTQYEASNDLESSFIFISKEDPASNKMKNDGDFVNISKSEYEHLLAELEKQRQANKTLVQQNAKYLRMCNLSVGMHDLLQENTMLKKSISNFRYHVKNYKDHLFSTTSNISTRRTWDEDSSTYVDTKQNNQRDEPLVKRVNDLENTVRSLSLTINEKDKEIEALSDYKKKWQGVKKAAREKKRQREQSKIEEKSIL